MAIPTQDKNSSSSSSDRKRGKQPAQSEPRRNTPGNEKKQAPTTLQQLLKQTGVKPSSEKDDEESNAGVKPGSEFEDIPLDDDPVQEREDPDYELIDHSDTSYNGEQHRSYNGHPDHARKYPKGFGKDGDRK
ncbi:hypothetical protein CERZMDRAFT_96711 [Cercospora zeae-maydis SCOH1-5]|uniref:Uncharacterized protein n=1 Tax=Cercospora zeae-maydis SCOH1-5 TaxID=717836 RepID=A0A6A6FIH6_9PEZI|nr:hypothetical protein CERZMDRAFT_96711 [Cercospora zeae-maydis SCOH1-5]